MKMKIIPIALAIMIMCGAGCTTAHQSQSNAPRMTVSQKLNQLHVGMQKHQVVSEIGQPNRHRTVESADGRTDIWLYNRDTLVTRIEGSGASFMHGFRQGVAKTGPDAPLELHFVNNELATIVNR
jgi:hypothetical protein